MAEPVPGREAVEVEVEAGPSLHGVEEAVPAVVHMTRRPWAVGSSLASAVLVEGGRRPAVVFRRCNQHHRPSLADLGLAQHLRWEVAGENMVSVAPLVVLGRRSGAETAPWRRWECRTREWLSG